MGIGFFAQDRSLGSLIHNQRDRMCTKLKQLPTGEYACDEFVHGHGAFKDEVAANVEKAKSSGHG